VAARCSARLAPPLFRDGWEGDNENTMRCEDLVFVKQAGKGGRAMPVNGLFTWWFRGEGAIRPRIPPQKSNNYSLRLFYHRWRRLHILLVLPQILLSFHSRFTDLLFIAQCRTREGGGDVDVGETWELELVGDSIIIKLIVTLILNKSDNLLYLVQNETLSVIHS
jgi:hypothetical protein